MINAGKLLADLKRLRKVLDADLRTTHAAGARRDVVQAEWREAFDLGRTRDTFEAFLDGAFDQAVVHWVLGCVFLRFLEDNLLVDRPFLSGPGERLDLAKERQEGHFRAQPHDSDTEYLLATFGEAARLPGMAGLFDPAHNPLFRLPLSGDGAMALIRFFREVLPETGELTHDFADPDWDTRFLGDLYQDLSEEARKRYALLQTPDFVESWILDRTLESAIREFGHERVTMIDPACGSGHFLLGGFARLLREWQKFAPGLPPPEHAQRALDAVAGVDLNPFAVEVARFRLLVAALRSADVRRLSAAPGFTIHLAAGDSLLHGRHFFKNELGGAAEGFRRVLRHHYVNEDTAELDRILGRQYHVVVGNPPYITPKDPAMRDAYREIYASCHMKYGLGVPFAERFFDLALPGGAGEAAGYVGLIVANSFMKREFGSKLIQEVFPRLDITHVVDCSGAYIPGHGTPTVILFGRNRPPVATVIRIAMSKRGEPTTPDNPADGLVWSSIVTQIDNAGSTGEFVSVADISRLTLSKHPWSIGGGGAIEVKTVLESSGIVLDQVVTDVGFGCIISEEDAFVIEGRRDLSTSSLPTRSIVVGEAVRDWCLQTAPAILFPYSDAIELTINDEISRALWPSRTLLLARRDFGDRSYADVGRCFAEYHQIPVARNQIPLAITFAEVASHNHFVVDFGGKVFNQTAPIIKLPANAGLDDYFALLGLLNSSTACFWMKQVSQQKQMTGGDGVRVSSKSKVPYQFSGTRLRQLPLPKTWNEPHYKRSLTDLARRADTIVRGALSTPASVIISEAVSAGRDIVDSWQGLLKKRIADRSNLICIQEDLDFLCYEMYGLIQTDNLRGLQSYELTLSAGDRPFCILSQENQDDFAVPKTVPSDWPEEVGVLWRNRMLMIESSPSLQVIEDPHYKRRWIGRQGLFNHDARSDEFMDGLREWLLDRVENLLAKSDQGARLISADGIADLLRRDPAFMSVVSTYAGRADVSLEPVLADLLERDSVPFLAGLRYTETGMRKRAQWEETWTKQRGEDLIDANVFGRREEFRVQAETSAYSTWRDVNRCRPGEEQEPYAARMRANAAQNVEREIDRLVAEEQVRRKLAEVGKIPAPPKYVAKDFQKTDFWRLRGSLDVPKERFVSFPNCQRDSDGSRVVTWAGHNHLKRALAVAAYYQERKDSDGWPAERLVPLLAGVIELVPWLLQWHNEYDPDLGARMGDYFVDFVQTEARALGMTEAAVAAWTPPATPRRGRTRRAA